jgi:hypothetical protein
MKSGRQDFPSRIIALLSNLALLSDSRFRSKRPMQKNAADRVPDDVIKMSSRSEGAKTQQAWAAGCHSGRHRPIGTSKIWPGTGAGSFQNGRARLENSSPNSQIESNIRLRRAYNNCALSESGPLIALNCAELAHT